MVIYLCCRRVRMLTACLSTLPPRPLWSSTRTRRGGPSASAAWCVHTVWLYSEEKQEETYLRDVMCTTFVYGMLPAALLLSHQALHLSHQALLLSHQALLVSPQALLLSYQAFSEGQLCEVERNGGVWDVAAVCSGAWPKTVRGHAGKTRGYM